MPTYAYKARNASSQLVEGVLEGVGAGAIAELLRGQGLTPVDIRETQSKSAKSSSGLNVTLFR